MSVSNYQEISVATGVTGPAIPVHNVNSNLGVQVVPASGGSAKLQYSLFTSPETDAWIDWIHGVVTSTKCIDLAPSIRNIRLVSISGTATAVISGRAV